MENLGESRCKPLGGLRLPSPLGNQTPPPTTAQAYSKRANHDRDQTPRRHEGGFITGFSKLLQDPPRSIGFYHGLLDCIRDSCFELLYCYIYGRTRAEGSGEGAASLTRPPKLRLQKLPAKVVRLHHLRGRLLWPPLQRLTPPAAVTVARNRAGPEWRTPSRVSFGWP